MSNHPNSRKRAAPGAASMVPMQQPLHQQLPQAYATGHTAGDEMVKWNGGGDNVVGYEANGANPFEVIHSHPQYSQPMATQNNSLARRPMNRALVSTNQRPNFDASWNDFAGDETSLVPQNQVEGVGAQDSIEVLEEMAQKAKREAQAKRKQIPPFVQKLSSFLEEGKELIRWSEKGDSFIVVDEEEFAKTLIPELFKHNNYASFVRQLNMYGFHKRVGLSDNSMRASERKNKSPSEYSNPYFRRGHPNLLWLINKPKGGSKGKKPAKMSDADLDSEEEPVEEEVHGQGLGASTAQVPRSSQAARSLPSTESQPASRGKELALMRDDINQVREQQKLIMSTLRQLQQNNASLYNQAMLFQSQQDRNQNTINAILNFLANMFKKSLEDQGNTQTVSDIISSMIASQGQQPSQTGSVLDLGNFFQNQFGQSSPVGGGHPHKRARGLLPPIPDSNNHNNNSRAMSSPSSGRGSSYHSGSHQNPEMGQVTELVDGSPAETPPNLRQELENNPQERMMRIINDIATNSPGMNLPEATEFIKTNGTNPLNQDQRNTLSNFMAQQSSPPSNGTPVPGSSSAPAPQQQSQSKNRQTRVSPPPAEPTPSLSPILRSSAVDPLTIHHHLNNEANALEQLQGIASQQDNKVSQLSNMLDPLPPSDHIHGLEETQSQFYDATHDVDFDEYLVDFGGGSLEDAPFGGTGTDFDPFSASADQINIGQNIPSPTGTEEITREEFGMNTGGGGRGSKRRRVD